MPAMPPIKKNDEVYILRGKDRGQVILSFESNDDFDRLMEVLRGPANH